MSLVSTFFLKPALKKVLTLMANKSHITSLYAMSGICLILFFTTCFACQKNDIPSGSNGNENGLYFPPVMSSDWESVTPESLNWNTENLDDLYTHLASNGTRAFIILKSGKMVVERYWGNNILDTAPFDQNTNWYWASAGKTITAFLVGLAQEDGLLNIQSKTSEYLGINWTGMPLEKEDLITVRNQLTMTTGLDFDIPDVDCTDPPCLKYRADAGDQWYYHNAPYTLLGNVVSHASGKSYNQYTDDKLESKTGMNGTWIQSGYNRVYWSTARDAARFGLLILNKGTWDTNQILTDTSYFFAMVNTSQEHNPSYGFLWWLNGKTSTIFPGMALPLPLPISPSAPNDLIAAMGKNGQFIDIVPSQELVVVRMGEAPDGSAVPIQFHDELWQLLITVIE